MQAMCSVYGVNTELTELRNIVTVGRSILEAGLARKESRGGHYNADFAYHVKAAPTRQPRESFKRSRSLDMGSAPVRGSSPPRSRNSNRDVAVKSQKDDPLKE